MTPSNIPANANLSYHRSPPIGVIALIYMVLFLAGLYPVVSFRGGAHFPGPWETQEVIASFFAAHSQSVAYCSFLQFSAAIPLGIFTASVVSRLQFLGVKAAGVHIAAFGGWMTAFNIACTACVIWAMSKPAVAENTSSVTALYFFAFALGGPGFSVPFALLLAGICIPSAFMRLLPKWLIGAGLILALIGALSSLTMVFPAFLPLIPLTRFPGFIWLILTGFMLPRSMKRPMAAVLSEPGTSKAQ